jgi:hypothetical protein
MSMVFTTVLFEKKKIGMVSPIMRPERPNTQPPRVPPKGARYYIAVHIGSVWLWLER